MIGGNIPGETQVLSLALFEHVESLNFKAAENLAMVMLVFFFASYLLANGGKSKAFNITTPIIAHHE